MIRRLRWTSKYFSFYMKPFIYRAASITSVLSADIHRGSSSTSGLGFNPNVCVFAFQTAALSRGKNSTTTSTNVRFVFQINVCGKRLWRDGMPRLLRFYQNKKIHFLGRVCVKKDSRASVDFKDAEDVRRGWRVAQSVESEGRARDGLQLRASVQSQEAGHLARLQEVERVRPGGRGGPVTLHALQLLRPQAAGHHVQLHILRLLLIEQHLKETEKMFISTRLAETRGELVLSQLFKWKPSRLPQDFQGPAIVILSFFWLDFLQTSVNLTRPRSGYTRLPETWYPLLQKTWYVPVQFDWCLHKIKAVFYKAALGRNT